MDPDSPEYLESNHMSEELHRIQSHAFSLTSQASACPPSAELDKRFVCDVAGCSAGPYKRHAELKRHSKKHGTQQVYDCSAIDCNRTGKRGFTRKDKLVDHMLAGHDEDERFSCPQCGVKLSRDIFAVHTRRHPYMSGVLQSYRTCPLPRCSFKVKIPVKSYVYLDLAGLAGLDRMQHHLLEKHDGKSRTRYTNLLVQRGYDACTCEVVCPACTSNGRFPDHEKFATHFMQTHFEGPACDLHADGSCSDNFSVICQLRRLIRCTSVPVDVRQHQRTILRIWPGFEVCPIWDDIKYPCICT